MEFDEMKKIWDSQNHETFYALNEKALHNRVLSKKRQAHHITNTTELLWIIGNIGAGSFILGMLFLKGSTSIFMYLLSAWMFASALYTLFSRIRRLKANDRFDRSVRGDLQHAISIATYQLRVSQLGRWNILPIGVLTILSVFDGGKSVWLALGLIVFLVLAHYAGGWEHNIYRARKRELEVLQNKLENEELSDRQS